MKLKHVDTIPYPAVMQVDRLGAMKPELMSSEVCDQVEWTIAEVLRGSIIDDHGTGGVVVRGSSDRGLVRL